MSRNNKRAAWFGPCRNSWHRDTNAPHNTYRQAMPDGMRIEYYGCRTCDFRTCTFGTYIPTPKPCLECGNTFDGMPDYPEELCDDCFQQRLDQWVAEMWVREQATTK